MNNPPFSYEEEFLSKEKEITEYVIRVIAVAKAEKQLLEDEALINNIVNACKIAFIKTREFQTLMQGMSLIHPILPLYI